VVEANICWFPFRFENFIVVIIIILKSPLTDRSYLRDSLFICIYIVSPFLSLRTYMFRFRRRNSLRYEMLGGIFVMKKIIQALVRSTSIHFSPPFPFLILKIHNSQHICDTTRKVIMPDSPISPSLFGRSFLPPSAPPSTAAATRITRERGWSKG
jgi:hypothetical protein